jgi:2,3-bisphosphoglycerate-independent phosphoglycerate mutase
MQLTHKPTVLIILDGWGHTDNTVYNAVHSANKPTWDKIVNKYPNTLISASGLDVGLPAEQMGNSEVGHMNIGSGRVVDQEFTRISRAMENGSFYENEALTTAFNSAAENDKAVHLLGLLSNGGVHSHQKHIHALMELAAKCNVKKLYLHAFLDGRDTPPKSAEEYINRAQIKMRELGIGQFASIIGRHYAMDRNKNWDRTKLAYDLITQAKSDHQCADPFIAVDMAYDRDETDEFIPPTSIVKDGENPITVEDGDVVVFANYRADRARQLARAFTKPEFQAFEREKVPQLAAFVSLTSYKANYEFPVAFPPVSMKNVFGEYISNLGLNQLRIAETEKYAHVTFFFNGGEERVFEGEDRILVPSPHVSTYEQVPAMSADEVTERLLEAINSDKYDAIVCNYANADMVGHTGDFKAAVAAIEALDKCLEKVIECTQNVGGELLITADHGNAEQMRSYTTEKVKSQPHTAHTTNLVPLVYLGRSAKFLQEKTGTLSDIAPTMLHVMGLSQPEEMSGQSLLKFDDEETAAVVNE